MKPSDDLQAPTLLALEAREAGYKKRIEELEAVLRPFADFADPRNTIPPDTILTAGSPMARRQITMANCYAARAALQPKSGQ